MKARLIITPDGGFAAFIDEGTYEQGKAKLEALIKTLTDQGLELIDIGKVEQHKHDPRHVHLVGHDHSHNH